MAFFYKIVMTRHDDEYYTQTAFFENLQTLKERGPSWIVKKGVVYEDKPLELIRKALAELKTYDGVEAKRFEDRIADCGIYYAPCAFD